MNEKYFRQVKYMCEICGLAIDTIAKQFNISQKSVAKLFMEIMQKILEEVEK